MRKTDSQTWACGVQRSNCERPPFEKAAVFSKILNPKPCTLNPTWGFPDHLCGTVGLFPIWGSSSLASFEPCNFGSIADGVGAVVGLGGAQGSGVGAFEV